ncbi:MAG: hypothetical protein H6732_07660 [Alphaproteobacteria bacterium]|nr:hypothetical protein [Alphaproteobacteria bacterium]
MPPDVSEVPEDAVPSDPVPDVEEQAPPPMPAAAEVDAEAPAEEVATPPARVATTPRPAKPSPPAPPQGPLATAPDRLFQCTASADCIVHCDVPGGCCNDACGCRTAVNRHVLAELDAVPWVPCTERCPAVACMREDASGASCVDGRCRAGGAGGAGLGDLVGTPSRPPARRPDGAPCVRAADCRSGICEGQGCSASSPGTCQPRERMCTMDVRPYCGCDGRTFTATSGSCPGRRFRSAGPCPG